jgi:UDP-glucose 4-epimerase
MADPTKLLQGKRLLVTGGTGSMGKTLVRRVLSGERGLPERLVILSRDEGKQYDMRQAYLQRRLPVDEAVYENFRRCVEFRLGDVRSYADVCAALRDVEIVINAAALKHVPNCEYFPEQALLTNCSGPLNIVRAIGEHGYPVQTVVGISTDKACKPVSVMGMTKALHERIFTSAGVQIPNTRFICCRYGNVLASRGSVVPLFQEQIRRGGPVTITVPEMTRFLMSLDEAVDCVLDALADARQGETFVPCAPSATVLNVARALVGGRPIAIEVTGIRPGEKLHEIMVADEECHHTSWRGKYFAVRSMLPELHTPELGDAIALNKEFSSADTVISLEETVQLFERNRLLPGQARTTPGLELFEAA